MQLKGFDYQAELMFFISVQPSAHTQSSYKGSLRILEDWLARKSLAPADFKSDLAAEFIRYVREGNMKDSSGKPKLRAPNSVRSIVTACSSFYTHLEKRFGEIRNPFRGIQSEDAASMRERAGPVHLSRGMHR